jgi:hypothetical protein
MARNTPIIPDANYIRAARNAVLKSSDWRIMSDSPLSNSKKAEWKTFRQALRDIPAQSGFPTNVTWPSKPS